MSRKSAIFSRITSVAASLSLMLCAIFHCSITFNVSSAENEDFAAMIDEMTLLVNEARAEEGLNALSVVPVLNEIAGIRAEEIKDNFSHIRPDGSGFNTLLDEYKISFYYASENIAAGSSTAEKAFLQWKNSEGHWKNIMKEGVTHIGVGIVHDDASDYCWYWTQIFVQSDKTFEGQYLPQRNEVTPVSCGDIDGDGQVTSFDLVLLRKRLNNEIELTYLQLEAADCMEDGVITIADASILKKYLMGVYDTLPFIP